MAFSSLLSLAIFLFVRLACTIDVPPGQEVVVGNGNVPLDIPLSDWTTAVAHPNTTGIFPIYGPVLDGGTGVSNTWSINMTVTAGIPLTNTANSGLNKSQVFDGTQIILNVSVQTQRAGTPEEDHH
jgi:hypothetical protein